MKYYEEFFFIPFLFIALCCSFLFCFSFAQGGGVFVSLCSYMVFIMFTDMCLVLASRYGDG